VSRGAEAFGLASRASPCLAPVALPVNWCKSKRRLREQYGIQAGLEQETTEWLRNQSSTTGQTLMNPQACSNCLNEAHDTQASEQELVVYPNALTLPRKANNAE
jgi:hypothetical protein